MAIDRQELIALFDHMGVDIQYGSNTPAILAFREELADAVLRLEARSDASQEGSVSKDDLEQHPRTSAVRPPTEAGRGDCAE